MIYSIIKYLVIPEIENYEVFSYIVGGGMLFYMLYYFIIFLIGSILNQKKDTVLSIFFSFILLEIILLIFLDGCLVVSFFTKDDIGLFLLFQAIPMLTLILTFGYRKDYNENRKIDDSKKLTRK